LTQNGSVSLIADRLGNAIGSFQTVSNSFATAPPGYYFTSGSFSITMWVNIVNSSSVVLFDFGNGDPADNVDMVTNQPGYCPSVAFFQVYSNSSGNFTCFPSALPVGVWLHLAFTYNITSLTASAYVNGNLTVSAGSQYTIRNVTRNSNNFGANSLGEFPGNYKFDEIKFHSRVLSAQEVLNDFAYNQSYVLFV
jgi:hypothetical protein